MKRYGYLVVLVLVAVVFTGCGGGSRPGAVAGYVYVPAGSLMAQSASGVDALMLSQSSPPRGYEPLRGAEVRVENTHFSKYTESDGYFYIGGLTPGGYTLTVNDDSLRFEVREHFQVTRGKTTWFERAGSIVGGIGYYVVIGIDNYPGEPRIPGTVKSAERVYDALFQENKLAGLGDLLINRDATKGGIRSSVRKAVNLAEGEDDYLVIYFAGLSERDILSPSDDPGNDWSTAITDAELEGWVRDFPGSVTLIIDGSESSTMADDKPFEPFAFREPEYTVISAAGPGEGVFYDPDLDSSVFTHFLVEGISGWNPPADLNRDGDITSNELYQYINGEMDDYLRGDPDRHIPSFWGTDYRNSVIFRY